MEPRTITVSGAREHNLKNVSLTIPRGKLICFTGVSGSGKSSFAFDTLFAEGQRRYLESLSSYARQFLGQLAKPDVDRITGLSPAISIQQKTSGWNPRSTVGTVTQIHDYLRVLFARVGRQHCPKCGQAISAQTREQIITRILELPPGSQFLVMGPVIRGQKGEYRDWFEDMIRQGYARARVDGQVVDLKAAPALSRHVRHNIEIVVDRLTLTPNVRPRLAEAVENAMKLGSGTVIVQEVRRSHEATEENVETSKRRNVKTESHRDSHSIDNRSASSGTIEHGQGAIGDSAGDDASRDLLLSSHYACPKCDLSFEPPSPQLFSFNSPTGMCLACDGMGTISDFDPDLLVTDPSKSFLQLAVEPMRIHMRMGRWRKHIYKGVADQMGFDLRLPWQKLPENAKQALLFGLGETHVSFQYRSWGGRITRHGGTFPGVIEELRERHRKAQSSFMRAYYEKYMRKRPCPDCKGGRLNPQALAVRVGGKNINELSAMPIQEVPRFFEALAVGGTGSLPASGHASRRKTRVGKLPVPAEALTPIEQLIATDALKEIRSRLEFLHGVGLDYLSLERTAPTLSGGESQRIRLAGQLGAGLVGVLYILDEPSIGLHPRDNEKLLASLKRLRDLGNTVIVVEHDEQTMLAADQIVDFGPGPGVRGGEVVAQGDLAAVTRSRRSITAKYLRGEEEIAVPKNRRPVRDQDSRGDKPSVRPLPPPRREHLKRGARTD